MSSPTPEKWSHCDVLLYMSDGIESCSIIRSEFSSRERGTVASRKNMREREEEEGRKTEGGGIGRKEEEKEPGQEESLAPAHIPFTSRSPSLAVN